MVHARSFGAVIFSLVIALAACGGDDDDSDETRADSADTTEADEGASTTDDPYAGDVTTTTATEDTIAVMFTVQTGETALGSVLVDGDGRTLYGFKMDSAGTPTCAGGCAGLWPAVLVETEPVLGPGLDPAVITTVAGAEGGTQVKAGQWPLYRFSNDAAPGETNGQGLGGVWYVVAPNGTLIEG